MVLPTTNDLQSVKPGSGFEAEAFDRRRLAEVGNKPRSLVSGRPHLASLLNQILC